MHTGLSIARLALIVAGITWPEAAQLALWVELPFVAMGVLGLWLSSRD